MAVLLPALILVGIVFAMIRKNQESSNVTQTDSGKSSWRFSERSPGSSRQTTPLKLRAASPLSESSDSIGADKAHKPRKYDGVYYTHEPLPGKPDIDFEDKQWDLTLKEDEKNSPVSTTSSSRKPESSLTATASPSPVAAIVTSLPQSTRTSDV